MLEFVHPALRNYRLELFKKLNRKYDIKFIFTKQRKDYDTTNIPKSLKYENITLSGNSFGNSLANWVRFMVVLLTDDYKIILTSPAEAEYNLLAYVVSKLRSKKIIFWGESWIWPSSTLIKRIYYYFIVKRVLERCDAIIAMGEKQYGFYKKVLKRKEGIYCAPKYVWPYKKRDTSQFIKKIAIEDEEIIDKKIILYMSQIIRRKGLDYLIEAFKLLEKKLDNVYLLVVGSGPFESHCKKLAKKLDIKNIMFKGYVADSDIELYHNLCNVLVLPSIFLDGYPEPNGYVLYESMGVGKPLVVTDAVGATPELVQDGVNGFVVANKNVEELHNALHKILTNEKLEKKMGEKSKEIYNKKINFEKQFEIFKNVIEYIQKSI